MRAVLAEPPSSAGSALTTAASLLAAAALLTAAGDTRHVSVTVTDIQVSRHAGEAAARAATVAAYAQLLHSVATRRPGPGGADCWLETSGQVGGHPVHVWTLIHGHEQET